MKLVSVVIPVYKEIIDFQEILSFKQCLKILGDYDIILVAPKSLNLISYTSICNFEKVLRFDDQYFKSVNGYNKLMLSKSFYHSFTSYEYILIYQLDAYVFRDELKYWCGLGYDYIGAPVFNVKLNSFGQPIDVCTLNGGFSLRKISSHTRILTSFKKIYPWRFIFENNINETGFIIGFLKSIYNYFFCNNTFFRLNKFDRNEDLFWAIIIPKIDENFKVPDVKLSCFFSFDNNPDESIKMTKGDLPFGCHAFTKYLGFWENYISTR